MDRSKFQYEGLKWLFELELINHPQVINTIRFNVLLVSKQIKEVELLMYRENKSMLVLLELGWIGRRFQKKRIFTEVQDTLTQLLPSFRFRITDDPKIMELAIEKVKKALTGGKHENPSSSPDGSVKRPAEPNVSESAGSPGLVPDGSQVDPVSSEKEPSEAEGIVRSDLVGDDSKQE